MPRLHTARLAHPDRDLDAPQEPSLPRLGDDLVIATVSPRSGILVGADWIRIDGILPPVEAAALRTRHEPCNALIDIPGAHSPRSRSTLTTTESLVFAASAEFGWINLGDVEDPVELERARFFVGDRTRLSCTVGDPRVLQRHLDDLCTLGDALILDLRELGQKLPPTYLEVLLHAVLVRTTEHETPTLLIPGLAPQEARNPRGAAAALGPVGNLLGAGARGLVLTRETEFNPEAQSAVDLARELIEQSRAASGHRRARNTARVIEEGLEDPSGWFRRPW